jgi:hypothetical protein
MLTTDPKLAAQGVAGPAAQSCADGRSPSMACPCLMRVGGRRRPPAGEDCDEADHSSDSTASTAVFPPTSRPRDAAMVCSMGLILAQARSQRRTEQGLSTKDIIWCLKRCIAREIYYSLQTNLLQLATVT